MGRWVAICMLAGLAVVALSRFFLTPVRDSWQVVVGESDGSITILRFTVANTGLFANEETTRVAVVRDDNFPLEHRAVGGPGVIDSAGVHGTADTLERDGNEWAWQLSGDAMRSAGHVSEQGEPCPGKAGSGSGFLDVPNFTSQAAEGGLVRGPAMVFRTSEPGPGRGAALYAMSSAGALFVDPAGHCPAWITLGDERWSGEVAPIDPLQTGAEIHFGPHTVVVRPGERFVRQGPETTTLLGERWLAWLAGNPLPSVVIRSVLVRVDGAGVGWSGATVERSDG